ncbi:MAG: anthranilate synthase component I family protein, partial [Kofleriaceae bacterium]|nr:anthranilate synthase component I family protein [Kofleriaceae bacterium]
AYIAAGDVYQVNVARRWSAQVLAPGDALALLASIDGLAPAPYSGMLEFAGATLVSASPEMFLQQRGRRVETRPIKGTRPRTGDVRQDAAARADLMQSEKDSAEHLMIVDLERNDLGRICDVGSVQVSEIGYVVELPQLYHRVSRVRGTLRAEVGIAALLQATFPGGSITGAPKVRAMQIIAELEPWPRGPYCGGFGWFGSADGAVALELAIGIRIGVLTANALHVYVGGGIVADSDPRAEVRETDDKLAGWRAALQQLR